MAEVKNNFLGAKMNRDIDDRIVPKNEYRSATNIQVSRSENSDVGSLQTALGNELLVNFNTLVGIDYNQCLIDGNCLDCIGQFVDTANNRVFIFLTSYKDQSLNGSYSIDSENYIYLYDLGSGSSTMLVKGSFLNFSKNKPIIGVNLLENLLFWTDNRNQPRKINIVNAANNINYYFKEDNISVAKLAPEDPIILFEDESTTMKDVSSKSYPNGGDGFVNVTATSSNWVLNNTSGQILVGAKVGVINPLGQITNLLVVVDSYDVVTKTVVLSNNISLLNKDNIVFNANPFYNGNFVGDPDFFKDKFARFSYRYKFDDGEYSIFAPFTQVAFIPQQDGYFTYFVDPAVNDEESTYRSTEVSFVQNKVTEIKLIIKLPYHQSSLQNETKISAIELLYKESDSLAVQVLDVITIDQIKFQDPITPGFYYYKYNSQKPYKTLPSKEITRVYDKIPVKAFGQEIISNRVVYSNYQDKHTPPPSVNYNVAITTKLDYSVIDNNTSIVEYPNHSVKQNRSYQVGIVLSDKFGRQSTTLLSPNTRPITIDNQTYYGSTVFFPYINNSVVPNSWPGSSIKVLFNDPIPVDRNGFYPGVYNGDTNSVDYNPLGWYSYKIVVKQLQQEYYNVYLPGVMAAYPEHPDKELGKTSHAVLINDNINKVPRDLSEIGPVQVQFRSSVSLYGRVENTINETYKNKQFYPDRDFFVVSTISNNNQLFNDPSSPPVLPSQKFYNINSNPLIGRISTTSKFGVIVDEEVTNLAVLETEPVDSRIEIFWETTTTGLISELNEAIFSDTGAAADFGDFTFDDFNEGILLNENIIDLDFFLVNSNGLPISSVFIDSFNMTSVFNTQSTPQDVSSYFELITTAPGSFNIKVTSAFINDIFYGFNTGKRNFTFSFVAVVNGVSSSFTKYINLKNLEPIIETCPVLLTPTLNQSIINSWLGRNGSSTLSLQNLDLEWTIASQIDSNSPSTQVNYFNITSGIQGNYSSSQITNNTGASIPISNYDVVLRLSDASGLSGSKTCSFTIAYALEALTVIPNTVNIPITGQPDKVFNFLVIYINTGTRVGYWTYMGTWEQLTSGIPGSNISIPSSGYGCNISWLKSVTQQEATTNGIDCINPYGSPGWSTAVGIPFVPINIFYFT